MELLKNVYFKNFLGRTSANILSQDSDSRPKFTEFVKRIKWEVGIWSFAQKIETSNQISFEAKVEETKAILWKHD